MVGEIFAGLGAFKTMLDLAKGLKDINDATTRNSVAIELQEKIIATQSQQATLIERVRELEAQVACFEAWEVQKQRYELTEITTGVFAHLVKPAMRGGEPVHCACSDCYQRSHLSILQITGNTYGSVTLRCPRCKTEFFASEDDDRYPFKRQYATDKDNRARAALADCPLCRLGKLRVAGVRPHPIFGDIGGLQVRVMRCDNPKCGHSEDREYDPNKNSTQR